MKEVSFGKLFRVSKLQGADVMVKLSFGDKDTDVFIPKCGMVTYKGFIYYVDTVGQKDVVNGRWVISQRYRVVRKKVKGE